LDLISVIRPLDLSLHLRWLQVKEKEISNNAEYENENEFKRSEMRFDPAVPFPSRVRR
jgi:hypothetical protein